jgi:NADP-dependent 3-hydroxy acid dehydrogenase YdfG
MSATAAQPAPTIPGRFAGKVVVITGASSGLGEATARLLSAQGASVVLARGARTASRRLRANCRGPAARRSM